MCRQREPAPLLLPLPLRLLLLVASVRAGSPEGRPPQGSTNPTTVPPAAPTAATTSAATTATAAAPAGRAPTDKSSFYVANRGDDEGPGTVAKPWRTLGRLANLTLAPGDAVYLQSGDIWNEQLALGGTVGHGMGGCMDKATQCTAGNCTFVGWAVDCGDQSTHGATGCQMPNHSAALPPVRVSVLIDGTRVATTQANIARPDLVTAGAAPDPNHGFNLNVELDEKYRTGHHELVVAVDCSGCGAAGWPIPPAAGCLCDGAICPCKAPLPGSGPPPPPPVLVTSTDPAGPRPIIRLDGIIAKTASLFPLFILNDHFSKTGCGQTQRTSPKKRPSCFPQVLKLHSMRPSGRSAPAVSPGSRSRALQSSILLAVRHFHI
jgi:hypothetical protein|eukprot:COSAG06_NODE_5856_length_3244_cov_16.197774_5_plen_377_part_00